MRHKSLVLLMRGRFTVTWGSFTSTIILGVLLTTLHASHALAAELSAGVARLDLTPPLELNAPLGGYGERMNRPAQGVHDRIFAKALVLSDGTQKFALVTADMLGFPLAVKLTLIDRISDDGWSEEKIMLLASHSHTSIEMNAINPANIYDIPQMGIYNPRLFDFVVERLLQVIRDADRNLVRVTVGTSSSDIRGWNRNRRSREGVTDDELTVTRLDTADGKPLAALVNFTAHPTFMSADEMLFSAGWPGHMQRTVEALIGGGVTVMYYNGAEGDQSPVARDDSGPSRWERAERYGRDLGIAAWNQWRGTKTAADVAFRSHLQTLRLPDRTWHPDFMQTGGKEYGLSEEILKEMLPRMSPAEVGSVSLRVGELVIVGIPGEMAAGLGMKVKSEVERRTGAQHATIGGLADVWVSYILSAEEYRRGGYEASVSFYGEGLGERIVQGATNGAGTLGKNDQ